MGYRVVAISRGRDKEELSRQLGAHHYIDSTSVDTGAALRDLGSVALVLTSALATDVMPPLIKGIGSYGKLIILSLLQPGDMVVDTAELFMRGISIQALPTGPCIDSEKAVEFAHLHGMECCVETLPLDRANEAYGMLELLSVCPGLLPTHALSSLKWSSPGIIPKTASPECTTNESHLGRVGPMVAGKARCRSVIVMD